MTGAQGNRLARSMLLRLVPEPHPPGDTPRGKVLPRIPTRGQGRRRYLSTENAFNSPKLNWRILDIELEPEEARPLPSGIPDNVLVLVRDKRQTQSANANGRDLPACFARLDLRPACRVYWGRSGHDIISIADPENILTEVLKRITHVPRELPDEIG